MDELKVGFVTQVKGTNVKAKIAHDLYQTTYFFNGKLLRGIAINEFVLMRKGYQEIVGKIIGEEIIENINFRTDEIEQKKFDRYVELNIVGYFFENKFNSGIKFLPIINDSLHLISDEKISEIYNFKGEGKKSVINIGISSLEELPIAIPLNGVFNSHIGIFGNTGSGKSNTLAKLYSSLFDKIKNKPEINKSKFVVIDFNGEYDSITKNFPEISHSIRLSTRDDGDKLFLTPLEFWDDELLSVLFSATEKTQKPFLTHLIRSKFNFDNDVNDYLHSTIRVMFGPNPHKETINLLKSLTIYFKSHVQDAINDELSKFTWHSGQDKFLHPVAKYIDSADEAIAQLSTLFSAKIEAANVFEEIVIRATLQLINSVSRNYVQYEHISPLISKISAMSKPLSKVVEIQNTVIQKKPVLIISLKECNQQIKKQYL